MKKIVLIALIQSFILMSTAFPSIQTVKANSEEAWQAAFVRNQGLWVKIGEKEVQITSGDKIHYPQWSVDGQWLAYQKMDEQTTEIWVYHLQTGQQFKVFQTDYPTYRWSSHENKLAFLDGDRLKVVDTERLLVRQSAEMEEPNYESVIEGVGNFSWLPDGSGFLVSTAQKSKQVGWEDIELLIVPEDTELDKTRVKHLFTLPSQTEDYFAISTSSFKWSPDGKWIAFLGIPTASLSADANTLFVLSSDGQKLIQVDDMLNNENWFKWAPSRNFLAYIEGVGRMANQNKHLKIKKFLWRRGKQTTYTPEGYVDWDFTWQSDRLITISRAQEKEWQTDPKERALPNLVQIDLKKNIQHGLIAPPEGFGDFYPVYLRDLHQLSWIRYNRQTAEVWLANPDGSNARRWISDIDPAPVFYEKWDWPAVIDYYSTSP